MNGMLPVIAVLLSWGWALQEPPPGPPPPPHPPDIRQHLSDLRRQLRSEKVVNVSAQRAVQYAKRYLGQAEKTYHAGKPETAERLAAAADCFLHVAEHQQHLMAGGGPKGPPPPAEIEAHLQRVYFRTQQADYFLTHSLDPVVAAGLPDWAHGFYELAQRGYERKEWIAADENAKCAEEVVNALENLAQAANMEPMLPPLPPAGPPKPPLP